MFFIRKCRLWWILREKKGRIHNGGYNSSLKDMMIVAVSYNKEETAFLQ